MKRKNKINIAYEPDADVLSMSWGKINSIDHAEENGEVILHVNKKDEPVLVEILNASKVFQRPILSTLKSDSPFKHPHRTTNFVQKQKLVAA